MRNRVCIRLLPLFALLLVQSPAQAVKPATSTMVLTAHENGLTTDQQFVCYGRIHGYIRFAERQHGAHRLSSRWIAPDQRVSADSETTVDFRPGRSTAYVWFGFPESSGLPGFVDPELDRLRTSYNGTWRVEVTWDDQPLLQSSFTVRCP